MLVSSPDYENRRDSTRDNIAEQSVLALAGGSLKVETLAGGSLKVEILDVASYALVSQNPATPFFLLKNWYGHGRTGRTGGAGPGLIFVLCMELEPHLGIT